MLQIGEKIKTLRKQKNISQEVFAGYLGVTFQAVSKWENGITLPDVTLIPAIASFFGVSTDELFDFNLYETEKRVEEIVCEHSRYWNTDKKKAEQIIRDGLKKYPGNDILLNCLIGVLELPEQSEEVISIAKALVESTKYDEVRLDAYRIMAEAYAAQGDLTAAKDAIEHIILPSWRLRPPYWRVRTPTRPPRSRRTSLPRISSTCSSSQAGIF